MSIYPGYKYSSCFTNKLICNDINITDKVSFFSGDAVGIQQIDYSVNSIISVLKNIGLTPNTNDPVIQQGTYLSGTGFLFESAQGFSVSISKDGNTVAIGGRSDNGSTGAVWIFVRNNSGIWTQQGSKLVGDTFSDFGWSVSLSSDGNTLAIGAPAWRPLFGNQPQGAIFIYTRSGTNWSLQAGPLRGTGASGNPYAFGYSVSISSDGNTLAVGCRLYNFGPGAIWVYIRSGTTWSEQAGPLVGTGGISNSLQGWSVAISRDDGNTIMVGGPVDDNSKGAVWVFTRSGVTWTQEAGPIRNPDTSATASFGISVALSSDGNTAIIGGPGQNTTGAFWIYTRTGTSWSLDTGPIVGTGGQSEGSLQGTSVALSGDGTIAVIGGPGSAGEGQSWVFKKDTTWSQLGQRISAIVDNVTINVQGFSVAISYDATTIIIGAPNSSIEDNPSVREGVCFIFIITEEVETLNFK